MAKKKRCGSTSQIKGMFRVAIADPDGTIVGDSGYNSNVVTADAINDLLDKMTNYPATVDTEWIFLALGTGTVPAFSANALPNELTDMGGVKRLNMGTSTDATWGTTISTASTATSKLQYLATFAASYWDNVTPWTIRNVGIYNDATGNTLMCGNTYATSALASNQAVYVTYELTLVQS